MCLYVCVSVCVCVCVFSQGGRRRAVEERFLERDGNRKGKGAGERR